VFLIQHQKSNENRNLLKIVHENGHLIVSSKHYLMKNTQHELQVAELFKVGDDLMVISNDGLVKTSKVVDVTQVTEPLRNVHTVNDRLLVNGVMASSFPEVEISGAKIPVSLQRVAVIPLRILYGMNLNGIGSLLDESVHALVSKVNAASVRMLS